jgi:hypothetical protein
MLGKAMVKLGNAPFSTSNAAVSNISGIIQFSGAIATTGTNPDPFVLPVDLARHE